MPQTQVPLPPIRSARPAVTEELTTRTGLDDAMLTDLVHGFYSKIRVDPVLGPIFADRISDWEPHLQKMVEFWSSVTLMTGRYHGAPVPKHASLPVTWEHFERWLSLFCETAFEVCSTEGAAHVIDRAERFARSLHMASQDARQRDGMVPSLR